MSNKIFFSLLSLTATCLLLTAYSIPGVMINWGAAKFKIYSPEGVEGGPLQEGSLVQLIWDRDKDGIDPPGQDGLPIEGDELITTTTIGHGSFYPGMFSENNLLPSLSHGDQVYVRAWNGPSLSLATHYGDTRYHKPSLWMIDSDLNFTLDATHNNSWATLMRVKGEEESPQLTQSYLFSLSPNNPNPFIEKTRIIFTVPGTLTFSVDKNGERKAVNAVQSRVNLNVYDVSGRYVKNLVREGRRPGYYIVDWDGKDMKGRLVSSGIYFYYLTVGDETSIRKMIFIR